MSHSNMLIWTWDKTWRRENIEVPPILPEELSTIMAEWIQRVSEWSANSQVTHLIPPKIVRCVGCLAAVPMSYQPSYETLASFKCPECQKGPERSELIGTILKIEFVESYKDVYKGTEGDIFHIHLNKDKIGSWSERVPKGRKPSHKVGEQIIIDHWPTGYAEERIKMPTDEEFFEATKESLEEGIESLKEGKPLKTTVVEVQEQDSKE